MQKSSNLNPVSPPFLPPVVPSVSYLPALSPPPFQAEETRAAKAPKAKKKFKKVPKLNKVKSTGIGASANDPPAEDENGSAESSTLG